MEPMTRITKARTRLLLDFPWFGSLSMRLAIKADESTPTFSVDGTTMRFNTQFAESLADDELMGVVAHEVMHCALLHPYRRSNRDLKNWNVACDYVINSELLKAGLKLPADCLQDPQYDGLTADVIYARLSQQPQQQPGQQQPGSQVSTGDCLDDPGPGQPGQPGQQPGPGNSASDWQVATEQANAVCKGSGKIPGDMEELIDSNQHSREDWRSILREFIDHTVPKDYSWTSPNRRYISNRIYLPGMTKENLGHVVIAVDTSGSIDTELLRAFASELSAIADECKPELLSVIYCDSKVHRVDEFREGEQVTLNAVGRGGTRFTPVFEAIARMEEPVCLIYFTDLDASDTPSEPAYPVLWITSESVTRVADFGRTLRISQYE